MKIPLIITSILLSLPTVIFAQDKVYSPLVDLSNAGQGNDVQTFEQYINFLYGMSIAVAALLAVIKIIIAGAKYMMSDVIGNKEDAKNDIQGAVLGLLIIISAVVILELINPTLVKKEIKFDPLQSDRGAVHALAVQTVAGGQTAQQYADTLFEGVDACVQRGAPTTSQNGRFSVTAANANSCGDVVAQLSIFEKNCEAKGGTARDGGKGSGIVACSIPIDGAESAKTLANSIGNALIINTTQKVGAVYVKQSGTIITTDVNGACDNNVKDLPAPQQKGQFTVCMSNLLGRVGSICEDQYGKYDGSNTGAVTCQLPKSVKGIVDLTDAFAAFKAADPGRKYDTIGALSLSQERELCEKFAKGKFYDNVGSANSCIFY